MWENLTTELGHDVKFVQSGLLFTASNRSQLDQLISYQERDSAAGVDCKMVSPEQIRKICPPLEFSYLGGLYSPRDGHAEGKDTCEAYVNAARRLGAHIYTNTLCWDIEVYGKSVCCAVTNKGKIKTKTVVCAAGAYSSQVAKMVGFKIPIKVVTLSMSETAPVPPTLTVWWRGYPGGARQTTRGTIVGAANPPGGRLTDHNISFYDFQNMGIWMPRYAKMRKEVDLHFDIRQLLREVKSLTAPSRRARRTAGFSIFRFVANTGKLERGNRLKSEVMPALADAFRKPIRVWSGPFDITPDALPVIGQLDHPKGFVIVSGFSGHGFAIGPAIGRLVSDIIVDGRTPFSIESFDPYRFAKGKTITHPNVQYKPI